MTITIQDQTARATFSEATVVATDDCGGVTIELDANDEVVAATFEGRGFAFKLVQLLRRRYKMALSAQDEVDLVATF